MDSPYHPTGRQSSKNITSPTNRDSDVELQELLEAGNASTDGDETEMSDNVTFQNSALAKGISRRLYLSHFLSTWNSRVFEFGAVLFIAKLFPGTLLPVSVYAVVRSTSAIVFSPTVGRYIDSTDRLRVVRGSIGKFFKSRISILACYADEGDYCQLARDFPWHCLVSDYGSCWCFQASPRLSRYHCLLFWLSWLAWKSWPQL